MDKKLIAGLLKSHRTTSNLSVQEVIQKLKAKDISISEKTLYGYENGTSTPNVPIFIALCDIYNIDDIIGAVSGASHSISVDKATISCEEWHIDQYNDFFNADLYGKIYLLLKWGIPSFSGYEKKLGSLFPGNSVNANYDRLYNAFMRLNESGQGMLFDYAELLYKDKNLRASSTPTTSGESAV